MSKLIIVKRWGFETFSRLRDKFAGDRDVRVVLDRRADSERDVAIARERRRLHKSSERDYVVVHTPGEQLEFQSGDTVGGTGRDSRGSEKHDKTWSWWEK